MTLRTFDLSTNSEQAEHREASESDQQCLLCGGKVKEVTETGCFCCLNHLEQWLCLRGYRFPEQ